MKEFAIQVQREAAAVSKVERAERFYNSLSSWDDMVRLQEAARHLYAMARTTDRVMRW